MQVLSLFSHRESRHSLGWASLNEIYQHRRRKNLQDSSSKIAHFYTNFYTKSNNILFTTLKDKHIQLINGDKRKDDERKNE